MQATQAKNVSRDGQETSQKNETMRVKFKEMKILRIVLMSQETSRSEQEKIQKKWNHEGQKQRHENGIFL